MSKNDTKFEKLLFTKSVQLYNVRIMCDNIMINRKFTSIWQMTINIILSQYTTTFLVIFILGRHIKILIMLLYTSTRQYDTTDQIIKFVII